MECANQVGLSGSKQTRREHYETENELQDAVDGDAYDTEGQQDEPDQRIEEKRREGQGPAQDKQMHQRRNFTFGRLTLSYGRSFERVPMDLNSVDRTGSYEERRK